MELQKIANLRKKLISSANKKHLSFWQKLMKKIRINYCFEKTISRQIDKVDWKRYKKDMTSKELEEFEKLKSRFENQNLYEYTEDELEKMLWFNTKSKQADRYNFKMLMLTVVDFFWQIINCKNLDWEYAINCIKYELSNLFKNLGRFFKYYPAKFLVNLKYCYPLNRFFTHAFLIEEDENVYVVWNSNTPNTPKNSKELLKLMKKASIGVKIRGTQENVWAWDLHTDKKCELDFKENELLSYYMNTKKFRESISKDLGLSRGFIYLVLTDLCQSTHLWNFDRFAMSKALFEHDRIAFRLMKENDGKQLRNEGDSFLVAFFTKQQALDFAFNMFDRVTNIQYNKKINLGIKVVVSHGSFITSKAYKHDILGSAETNARNVIKHTPRNTICLSGIAVKSKRLHLCMHEYVKDPYYDDLSCK